MTKTSLIQNIIFQEKMSSSYSKLVGFIFTVWHFCPLRKALMGCIHDGELLNYITFSPFAIDSLVRYSIETILRSLESLLLANLDRALA